MKNFFNSLNTHTVFGVGAGSFVVGVAALFLQHPIDSVLTSHLAPATTAYLVPQVNGYLQQLAAPAMSVAALLLGLGRPPQVPAGPVKP